MILKSGLTSTLKTNVKEEHTATHVGSGDLEVLATPILISFMENASKNCVDLHLSKEETTVGVEINVKHIKPSKVGSNITIYSKLVDIKGKRLYFDLEAYDESGKIGEGNHIRYIVDREKFMNNIK